MGQEIFVDEVNNKKEKEGDKIKWWNNNWIFNRYPNKSEGRVKNFEDELIRDEINDFSKILRKDFLFIYFITIIAKHKEST